MQGISFRKKARAIVVQHLNEQNCEAFRNINVVITKA
jgi:hypothetical protein